MTLLENAKMHFARVRAIESMLADIDGLCGCGITTVSGKVNGTNSDLAFQEKQEIERLREKLLAEKEQSARDYIAAEAELATVSDDEMRLILYWRLMWSLPWHGVAEKLGPGNTSDMAKQKYSRFVRHLKRAASVSTDPMRGGTTVS